MVFIVNIVYGYLYSMRYKRIMLLYDMFIVFFFFLRGVFGRLEDIVVLFILWL